ncbi:gamma-glutamyltransferase family protein [Azospirillum sp. ST 5-10]|uniref:gamma-glutamyltransferase family protein n=1 Tax=unclassified Azospirillum TaxID=2630922 RepID=UPI003F4A397A
MAQHHTGGNRSARSFRAEPTRDVTHYPRMFGTRGAVSSHHYLSAQAGLDVLKAGGNAVDAAAAAVLVEGVVNQQMHSIGGELPILVGAPDGAGVVSINGNMAAPGAATPERFRALGHAAIPDEGVLAAGVPGALGAIVEALARFGRMSFADVSARAVELARDGFPVHSGLLRQHKFGIRDNLDKFRARWPGTAALYLPDGRMPGEGERLCNPALAGTYEHLAAAERAAGGSRERGLRAVFDAFYKGDVAREIVAFVQERGGLLERSDFDAFAIPVEDSPSTTFGGVTLHKCGPWTQGPAVLQALAILKRFDLRAMGHNSADYLHVLIETIKLAFADREQYYGDPRQVAVPLEVLLSDAYAAGRAALVGAAADREIRPGDARTGAALLPVPERLGGAAWGPGTVHVDAVDAAGVVAAFTPSGGWIRSSEVIPALGFPLGVRLANCYLGPDRHPNLVAPFKRPRTTISPSLAVRDGRPWLAFGSMGGDQQDQWQLQFFLNRVVFEMPIQQAIEAAKFSSEHFPGIFAPHDHFENRVRIEPEVGEAALDELRRRGHDVDVAPSWSEGFLCAAERDPRTGMLEAGADPRGTKSEVFPALALAC